MEAAVRHLRVTKCNASAGPFLLIQDVSQALGRHAVCCKITSHFGKASLEGRVIDLFSDPFDFLRSLSCSGTSQAVAWRTEKGLAKLYQATVRGLSDIDGSAEADSAGWCVVIDSLDHLLQHAGVREVLRFLEDLRSHSDISSVCGMIHKDLHTPQVLAALTSECTASMLLQPIQGLQKDMAAMTKGKHTWAPHGLLQLHLKRHTGRVRVESELYSLSQGGEIETDAAPQEVITAQLLAAHNVSRLESQHDKRQEAQERQAQAEEQAGLALLTKQAGMKLTLTQKEHMARQAVVLPYEHQGAGQAYKTGDFKDYLPQAAGGSGRGSGAGSLGHILYVRDSASEHDSDEDPDDDLDI
ncbi:hypothetical protein WJX77_011084 [Trebouxia sp. C0004]